VVRALLTAVATTVTRVLFVIALRPATLPSQIGTPQLLSSHRRADFSWHPSSPQATIDSASQRRRSTRSLQISDNSNAMKTLRQNYR